MEKLRHNQRRRVPRVIVDLAVTLIAGKKKFRSRVLQLSEFGILVASAHKDLIGQKIRVDLSLEPPHQSLSLSAVVVYTNNGGTGIRFEDESAAQHALLKSYVQARGIGIVKQ